MERKTNVIAEDGRHDLTITRDFDLPVDLIFKAYTEAEFISQWMGTRVVKLENKNHGGYKFETSDKTGHVVLKMNGTIHEIIPDKKIIRTFEMENTPYGVQLEFLSFENISDDSGRLIIHVIYESPEKRDQVLKLPFIQGINMAHKRLEEIAEKFK